MFKKTFITTAVIAFCAQANSAQLFISEYVEGTSYNKAVEIYNPNDSEVSLSGYSLSFFFNGSSSAGHSISLSGQIGAKSTFVVGHPNAAQALKDKANYLKSGSWFNGDDAITLSLNGNVVDSFGQVGFDPGSAWSSGNVSSQNMTLRRNSSVSNGDANATNAFDIGIEWNGFSVNDFSNLGSHGLSSPPGQNLGQCGDEARLISQIQGNGLSSTLVGEQVIVEAVVTGAFQQTDQLNGFYIQEQSADQDSDPTTSEGLFVSAATHQISVNTGDVVRLQGTVVEKYGNTQLEQVSASTKCGTETFSYQTISLPVNALTDYEAFEGMAIAFNQSLMVNDVYNLGRYGELTLATERLFVPTHVVSPGAAAQERSAQNNLKKIILDDASTKQNPAQIPFPTPGLSMSNPVRIGSVVSDLKGNLHFSYGQWRVQPIAAPQFSPAVRPTEIIKSDNNHFRVASFNVLNYFNGDGQNGGFPTARGASNLVEFQRQNAKIVDAIRKMDADVIGLMEIENDGYDTNSAIQQLVTSINNGQSNENHYTFVNPGVAQLGSDQIAVGFIYKTAKVRELGQAATIAVAPFDQKNRQPLAQTFEHIASGEIITIAVNHFKSKGSACDQLIYDGVSDVDNNDGQGNCNLTRTAAANALADWLASSPTGNQTSNRLIIGDLNAYAKEDPISALAQKGYTNLAEQYIGIGNYSYVFKGESGSLDHALASQSLLSKVVKLADWHINADEPKVFDYNTEFKTVQQIADWYSPNQYRASDHDPIIVDFALASTSQLFENVQADRREWVFFRVSIDDASTHLNIMMSGGTGDADLYVRYGQQPTSSQYLCRPYKNGNNEQCQITNAEAGDWYIGLRAYSDFSGVDVLVDW